MIEIKITENEDNQRLDKFLRKYLPNAPLSYIFKLLRKKDVKINDKRANQEAIIKNGDNLKIYITDDDYEKFKNNKKTMVVRKQFNIAYEDENILVVIKPKGLLVHGTQEEKKNTLVNQVITYLQSTGEYNPRTEKTFVPASVNRLDRNTSGLVLFGKNYKSLQILNKMIKEKNYIRKYYLTIVAGEFKKEIHLKDNISKNEKMNRVRINNSSSEDTKDIETIVKPIIANKDYSLVEVEIITGRTHQIRVHLASIGHPIIGDVKYGSKRVNNEVEKRFGLKSQLLHSYKLYFDKTLDELAYLDDKTIEIDFPMEYNSIKNQLFNT